VEDRLLGCRGCGSHRSDLRPDRLLEPRPSQRFHVLRHGGREQERLTLVGQGVQDLVDLGREAHIEEAVRLIENQGPDRQEIERALPHVIQHASRRPDHDVGSIAKRSVLLRHVGAADDQRGTDAAPPTELIDHLLDLHGQLARRHED
jgi:hypothetical protein